MVKPALCQSIPLPVILFLCIAPLPSALADDTPPGMHWFPVNHPTHAIPGDTYISPTRITFQNGAFLKVKIVRTIKDFRDQYGKTIEATVYRVFNQTNPIVMNGNHLCLQGKRLKIHFALTWPVEKAEEPLRSLVAPIDLALDSSTIIPDHENVTSICGVYFFDVQY